MCLMVRVTASLKTSNRSKPPSIAYIPATGDYCGTIRLKGPATVDLVNAVWMPTQCVVAE